MVLGAIFMLLVCSNLETAVGPSQKAQDFESESLVMGAYIAQTAKAAPITSDYGSKSCAFWPAPTAVSRFSSQVVDVDFDDSLGLPRLGRAFICQSEKDLARYELCKKVWAQNRPQKRSKKPPQQHPQKHSSAQQTIPKVLHQIWLSDAPLSKREKLNQDSWRQHHPNWAYKLWTAKELSELPAEVKLAIDQAQAMRQKEDLLRIYILQHHGGVVVDLTFQNLANIDALAEGYDFFAFLEPPLPKKEFRRRLHIAPTFIGACPDHPVILAWKEAYYKQLKSNQKNGFKSYLQFGNAVEQELESTSFCNVIFPPTYAFPINPRWAHARQKRPQKTLAKTLRALLDWREAPLFSQQRPESVATEVNGGSWTKDNSSKKIRKKSSK